MSLLTKEQSVIKNISIIGGGQMGSRIGLACAMNGFSVKIYDKNPDFKKFTPENIQYFIDYLKQTNRISDDQVSKVKSLVSYHTDLKEAVEGADLVSESILEDVQAKKEIWAEISACVSPSTIMTTNTSSLLPSMFSDAVKNKENFCAFHFHDLFDAKIVDIMPIKETKQEIVHELNQFAPKIDQVPIILKKENPGYAFNAMLIPWLNSACNLVRLDVCSPEEINNCWVVNTGSAKGPIELIDQVGLDLFHHVCIASGDPIALENAEFLKKNYIDKGFLGEKSGRGILVGAHKQLEKKIA